MRNVARMDRTYFPPSPFLEYACRENVLSLLKEGERKIEASHRILDTVLNRKCCHYGRKLLRPTRFFKRYFGEFPIISISTKMSGTSTKINAHGQIDSLGDPKIKSLLLSFHQWATLIQSYQRRRADESAM